MTDSQAKQVPLIDLLDAVPVDVRIGVDDGNDWKAGTTWHPVGRLCHEASAELRRLHELHVLYQDKVQRLELENFSWRAKLGVRGYENQFADMLDEIQRLRAELKLKREWIGLTDEEVMNCYLFWVVDLQDIIGFYKGIETKLREKNDA
jgi:hypothetical protein